MKPSSKRPIVIVAGVVVIAAVVLVLALRGGAKKTDVVAERDRQTGPSAGSATTARDGSAAVIATKEPGTETAPGAGAPTTPTNTTPTDTTPTDTTPTDTTPSGTTGGATGTNTTGANPTVTGANPTRTGTNRPPTTRTTNRTTKPNRIKTQTPAETSAGTPVASDGLATARAAYDAGNKRLYAGDPMGAIAKFKEALAAVPGFAAAHRGLGLAYQAGGDKAKAVQAFKTYLAASPGAKDTAKIQERIAALQSK